jgi:ParB-like chromosome segregation protein Spo0J
MTDGVYRVLDGQARLEACARKGINEIPVIISAVQGEAEQMKLALMLTTIREEGGAISEGEFINQLISQHGVSRQELTKLLGKSKAWLSKRQSLAVNLSDTVKCMVRDGSLCAKSAEEISKMPTDKQAEFAASVIRDTLSKTEIGQLVSVYRSANTSDEYRKVIIESPLLALPSLPVTPVKQFSRRKDPRGAGERIVSAAHMAIRILTELQSLLTSADYSTLALVGCQLRDLREVVYDMDMALRMAAVVVSPGKQGGERTHD